MDKDEQKNIQSIGDSKKKHGAFQMENLALHFFIFSILITFQFKVCSKIQLNLIKLIYRKILIQVINFNVNPISMNSFNNNSNETVVVLNGYRKKNWKNISKDKLIEYLNPF